MKVGDVIKAAFWLVSQSGGVVDGEIGLLVRIGKRHNNRPVGTVLTSRGIETWPLDPHYEYEVVNESR
jgi:hypothetical protein